VTRTVESGLLARLLVRHRPDRRGDAPPGLRPPVDPVRRARLAGDFLHDRMEHSPTSATGTGWERTPWHATQRAAWEALKKASLDG
jgi:hypothetical protein